MILSYKIVSMALEVETLCVDFVRTLFTEKFFTELQPLAPGLFSWLFPNQLRSEVQKFRDELNHPKMPRMLLSSYLTFLLDRSTESNHPIRPAAWLGRAMPFKEAPDKISAFLELFYPKGAGLNDPHEKECVTFVLSPIPIQDLSDWQKTYKLRGPLSANHLSDATTIALLYNDKVGCQKHLFDSILRVENITFQLASMVLQNYFYSSLTLELVTYPFFVLDSPTEFINHDSPVGTHVRHPMRNHEDSMCPLKDPSETEKAVYLKCLCTLFQHALEHSPVSFEFPYYEPRGNKLDLFGDRLIQSCPTETQDQMRHLVEKKFQDDLPPELKKHEEFRNFMQDKAL
jgi:hypothetical protein